MERSVMPAIARGTHNFRDVGGYPAADGRRVRQGLLFRSGIMTSPDRSVGQALHDLGIAAMFDLRDNDERARKPTRWHEDRSIAYHFRDHEQSVGDLREALLGGTLTASRAEAIMLEVYRTLPFEQADAYRQVMKLLGAGSVPLIFNCTAGKDRTGVLAALILHALGVDRTTIEHDYLLSNAAVPELLEIMTNDARYPGIATLPTADYLPLLRAEPHYLTAAFDAIVANHGSLDAYLAERLGVGPGERETIRERLLEAGPNQN